MTTRMKLTERERELVEAFRTERAIYNGALADALVALAEFDYIEELTRVVLALRRVD